jgi:hypothetical protein
VGDAATGAPDGAGAAGFAEETAPSPLDDATDGVRSRAADPGGAGGDGGGDGGTSGRAPWLLALLLLPAAWPAGRALLRRRGLVRGSREERLAASVSLLYADLRDHGAEALPSQTLDETAEWLNNHLDVGAGDLPARLQAVAFGGTPATEADLRDLAALRHRVHRAMRGRSGRLAALLALYGVRPPVGGRRVGPGITSRT